MHEQFEDRVSDKGDGGVGDAVVLAHLLALRELVDDDPAALVQGVNTGATGAVELGVLRNDFGARAKAEGSEYFPGVAKKDVATKRWQPEIDKGCMDPELFRDLGENGYVASGKILQFEVGGVHVDATCSMNGFNLNIGGHDVQLGRSGEWVEFGDISAMPEWLSHITPQMIFEGVRGAIVPAKFSFELDS